MISKSSDSQTIIEEKGGQTALSKCHIKLNAHMLSSNRSTSHLRVGRTRKYGLHTDKTRRISGIEKMDDARQVREQKTIRAPFKCDQVNSVKVGSVNQNFPYFRNKQPNIQKPLTYKKKDSPTNNKGSFNNRFLTDKSKSIKSHNSAIFNQSVAQSPDKEFAKITFKNHILSVFKETAKFNQTIKLKMKEVVDIRKSNSFVICLQAIDTVTTRDKYETDLWEDSQIKYISTNLGNKNKDFGIETVRERAILDLLFNLQNNNPTKISSKKGKTLKRPSINYSFTNIASPDFSDTSFGKQAMIVPDDFFTHTSSPKRTHSIICTESDSDSMKYPEVCEFDLLSNEFGSKISIVKTILYKQFPPDQRKRKKLGLEQPLRFRPKPSRCLVGKVLKKVFKD